MYVKPDERYILHKWKLVLSGAQRTGTERCLNAYFDDSLYLHLGFYPPQQEGVDRGHNT